MTDSQTMSRYWDIVGRRLIPFSEYSTFGSLFASYWKLEKSLILKLTLSYLCQTSQSKGSLILKTDLWNEAMDCSAGNLVKLLNGNNCPVKIIGIDISPVVCSKARMTVDNQSLTIACADVRELPFPDETFDVILDLSTLDHVPPDQTALVINEYKRTLKPGGIITLIFNPVLSRWGQHLQNTFNKLCFKEAIGFEYWWRLSPEVVMSQLNESGFAILDEASMGIFSLSALLLTTRRNRFLRKAIPQFLPGSPVSRFLTHFAGEHLFIARKK